MHLQAVAGREEPGKRHGKFAAGLQLAVQDPGGNLLRLRRVSVEAEISADFRKMPQEVRGAERNDRDRGGAGRQLLYERDVFRIEVDAPLA